MNSKSSGERGQLITLGELGKLGAHVAVPLSDNLPFDLVLVWHGRLYRAQVKSSRRTPASTSGCIEFDLRSSNWYAKTVKTYSAAEIDVMLLCDYERVYALGPSDFEGRKTFTLRFDAPGNNQTKGLNLASDYLLSVGRLDALLTGV